ncbi:uncharacterized protein LOC134235918 [Saccostrea cucullata]|uniref:uncharacterized protein LOC134235918 n=1 Tax=Saccostrea cuccullata TaxID=36930 RepID=UPI002ED6069A
MDPNAYSQLEVPKCSQCKGDQEFYCKTCTRDMCVLCKEKHMIDLDTKDHDVVIDRLKYGDFIIPVYCNIHVGRYVNKWCLSFEFPSCTKCFEHRRHNILDIVKYYDLRRQQPNEKIVQIRSNVLHKSQAILAGIKSDFKRVVHICRQNSGLQKSITKRTCIMKKLIDLVMNDISELKHVQLSLSLKLRLKEAQRNITNIEMYLYKFEQLLEKPLQFLLYVKKTTIKNVKDIPDTLLFSLDYDININDVQKLLGEIQITETEKRKVNEKQLLELMYTPVLKKSFTVKGANEVRHISYEKTGILWISDQNGQIVLTNRSSDPIYTLTNTISYTGGHSVSRDGNLIYIDVSHNINKFYKYNRKKKTIIPKTEPWKAECVYCSPLNEDILVGMLSYKKGRHGYTEAKVMRFSSTGQEIQSIQHNTKGMKLYKFLAYITENHNGDIIVSDLENGVVVTGRDGEYRFSYTGPPSGSRISPQGICVDALSHILVSDDKSKTVQMIDKDGNFLALLLSKENRITPSRGLSYDSRNHIIFVATTDIDNLVCVYRYIQKKSFNYLLTSENSFEEGQ